MGKFINFIEDYLLHIVITLLCIALIVLSIVAVVTDKNRKNANINDMAEQKQIEYVNYASYIKADEHTKIMYIQYRVGDMGYMSPYYSENGNLCRYVDGKIIEIEE